MHLPLGQLDECIQDCEKALSLLDVDGGGGSGGVEGEERELLRSVLLARVGEARQEMGDLQAAEDAFTKSLEAYHDDEVLAGALPAAPLMDAECHSRLSILMKCKCAPPPPPPTCRFRSHLCMQ